MARHFIPDMKKPTEVGFSRKGANQQAFQTPGLPVTGCMPSTTS